MSEWIEWSGGDSPVADDVEVEIRWFNDHPGRGIVESKGRADDFFWQLYGRPGDPFYGDIIAYRVVQP